MDIFAGCDVLLNRSGRIDGVLGRSFVSGTITEAIRRFVSFCAAKVFICDAP